MFEVFWKLAEKFKTILSLIFVAGVIFVLLALVTPLTIPLAKSSFTLSLGMWGRCLALVLGLALLLGPFIAVILQMRSPTGEARKPDSTGSPEAAPKRTDLGSSPINPRYDADQSALEGKWNPSAVLDEESILIVHGKDLAVDLLDRAVAGYLRDEIDLRGKSIRRRRAVVVSAHTWTTNDALQKLPTIAIGGDNVNDVTKSFRAEGEKAGVKPRDAAGAMSVILSNKRVALWGGLATQTRTSVQQFVQEASGLEEFLRKCWK